MQVENYGGARGAGGGQRSGAEDGEHVVHVHDVGIELARGGLHVVLVAAAAQQRERGMRARHRCRAPLEDGVRDVGIEQGGCLQLDGAFLASLEAIAVVHHEYAHSAGLRYPADGRDRRGAH